MKIKPRHFPHPVLSYFSDDFVNSSFSAEVQVGVSEENFDFLIDFNLKNSDLSNLVTEEKAKYMVHLEDNKTWTRLAEKSADPSIDFSIPAKKLYDQADINVFIVAEQEIPQYQNNLFHPDFDGETFQVKKGDILAIGPEITVDLAKRPLEKINSIFQLVKDPSLKEGEMSVNVESEKITISLSQITHSKYQQLIKDPNLITVFHSIIAVPALIYALSYIKEAKELEKEIDELKSRSWYKSISRRLENIGKDIESISSLDDPVFLANKIIDSPMDEAIAALELLTDEK